MNILILGGGAQGKATLFDISNNKNFKSIKIVENNLNQIYSFVENLKDERIEIIQGDAHNKDEMLKLFKEVDIVIDLLPTIFRGIISKYAIEAKTNVVNTSFQSNIKDYAKEVKKADIIIMPESGLDPGIDLVLAGYAVKQFDIVKVLESTCGGVPEKEFCDNPLNYKISWSFESVLSAYKRPASIIVDNKRVNIDGEHIFDYCKEVEIDGIGTFERYPNGFSTTYAKFLGIRKDVQQMGRYTLRWPGHCSFWKKISQLGLLEDELVGDISPTQFLAKILSPKLQYKDNERDLIILRNEVIGLKNGKEKKLVQQVVDKRDLKTGLMAMSRTVGFTASIIAQMILDGRIKGEGILNPCIDVPYQEFIKELRKRNIEVKEWFEDA
ncbi:saccharopine dehydrogenase NADP-binding domain-containing protein [archaeon]|nr:saccharopine dehydrogenase NADP-binding domain-containing protein [archaeon]MBL7057381.1 saccharopine dehydrogenase NADP-binding domain-containing protein [Candidatus Woesearchaeota archaeon]